MLDGWMWAMASRPIFDDDVGPLDSAAVTSTSPMATGSMSSRIRRRVSPAGSCSSPCRNTCPMYNRRSSKRPGFSPSSRHTPRASAAAARSFPFPSFGRSEQTGVSQRFARSGVGHGYFQSRFVRSLCLGGGSEKESQQQKSIWFHAFRVRPL